MPGRSHNLRLSCTISSIAEVGCRAAIIFKSVIHSSRLLITIHIQKRIIIAVFSLGTLSGRPVGRSLRGILLSFVIVVLRFVIRRPFCRLFLTPFCLLSLYMLLLHLLRSRWIKFAHKTTASQGQTTDFAMKRVVALIATRTGIFVGYEPLNHHRPVKVIWRISRWRCWSCLWQVASYRLAF
jgi:hypothetical protein